MSSNDLWSFAQTILWKTITVENDDVAVRHPSLWNFIRVLRDQQAVQEAVIENIRNGNPPPKRKPKWRILEGGINSLKEEYGNGERNLESYWHAVTYCVLNIN